MYMKNIIYGLWISKTLSQRRCPFLSLARILFLWLNSWWRTLQQSIIFPCRQVVTNPGPWAWLLGGPTSINAYRKLNTPKGEVGFGLNDVCTEDLFSLVLGRSFLVWIRKQDDIEDLDLESVQSTCQTYSIFMTPCGNTVTFCERSALWSVVSSGVDNPEAIMCMKNIIYGLWISKTLSQRQSFSESS